MRIIAYAVLSGHYHLLIQPGEAGDMAKFVGYLNTNVSKEVGRLYKYYGPKFQRYKSIIISDEPVVQIDRLKYILSQGTKEGLVDSPLDWPGVHCARSIVSGQSDTGTWFDRTQQSTAKNQRRKPKRGEVETDYEVKLTPLPCWAHHSKEGQQSRAEDLIRDIEAETKAMHKGKGTRALGVRKILRTNPFDTPEKLAWSSAPPIHVRSKELRKVYFEAYHTFLSAYRKAAELLKKGVTGVQFPEGCFPPGLPYVRAGPFF